MYEACGEIGLISRSFTTPHLRRKWGRETDGWFDKNPVVRIPSARSLIFQMRMSTRLNRRKVQPLSALGGTCWAGANCIHSEVPVDPCSSITRK